MSHRILPALSLAAVAVLGAAPLASASPAGAAPTPMVSVAAVGAAGALDCGLPAVPAVYDTVIHPAVVTTVPAVTHLEWRWARTVETVETEVSRVVTPAAGTWSWSRTVETIEREYRVVVVDEEAQPAVPEVGHHETRVVTPAVVRVELEYVQKKTGELRWEAEGWNAGQGGAGWTPTGASREVVLTPAVTQDVYVVDQPAQPAVPAVTHDEFVWVLDGAPAPADGTATGATRVASSAVETTDLPDGVAPAGDGWTRGAFTQTAAAVIEALWLAAGAALPDGFTPTGLTRPGAPRVEETAAPSPSAPEGDGWSPIDGTEVVIVDAEAYDRIDVPAWVEDFLVTPEVPATAPCPTEDEGNGVPVVPTAGGGGGAVESDSETAADEADEADEVVATTAGVLPATGAPVEPWLLTLAAGSVLLGARLLRRA